MVPVLVAEPWSHPSSNSKLSCSYCSCTEFLGLEEANHPWLVHQGCLDHVYGMALGFETLMPNKSIISKVTILGFAAGS